MSRLSKSQLLAFSGDAEGANEMTYSMGYLRQFCRPFQQNAATTRIFFPDKKVQHVCTYITRPDIIMHHTS